MNYKKWINLTTYHTMTLVPSYQKIPKVKIACPYSKEGDLYWLEDSPLTWL